MRASDRLRQALIPSSMESAVVPLSAERLRAPEPAVPAILEPRQSRLQQLRRDVERISRRYQGLGDRAPSMAPRLREPAWPLDPSLAPFEPRRPAAVLPPAVDPDGLLYQQRFAPGERLGRQPLPLPDPALMTSLGPLLAMQGLTEESGPASAREILFLDLETTGLSRGAGTLAFVIGLCRFEEDGGLLVEQILLRDPAQEPAALGLLQPRLEEARLIVTYNGRGFDLPVLRNRALLCRVPLALERPHLDLLPFCRRLFRARLPNCRLRSVERELLGLERVGDLDGAEAPSAYLRYLSDGSVENLLRVLEHNRLDVAVLAGLLFGVSQRAADPLQWAEDAEELLALGLLQLRCGRSELAEACLGRGLELCHAPVTRRRLLATLARLLRRRGLQKEASLLWERHCREFPEHSTGWMELAKYHEHTTKDLTQALALVERAPWAAEDRQRRLDRLRRRLGLGQ